MKKIIFIFLIVLLIPSVCFADGSLWLGRTAATNLPASNGSYLIAPFGRNEISNVASGNKSPLCPSSGVISNFRVLLGGAPGASKSRIFTLVVNGSNTSLSITISGSDTTGSDVDTANITAGQSVRINCTGTGTPAASSMRFSLTFTPTTTGETVLMGDTADVSLATTGTTDYIPLSGSGLSTTETAEQILIPCSGTIKNLRVKLGTAPGGVATRIFTVNNNGTPQLLTTTITGASTSGADTVNSFSVVAGDKISLSDVPATLVGSTCQVGVTFLPDIAGDFILASTSFTSATTDSYEITNGQGLIGASEITMVASAFTMKAIYLDTDTTPTGSFTYTFWKQSGTTSLAATLSGSNKTANASTNVSVSDGNTVSTKSTSSGGPSTGVTMISYLGNLSGSVTTSQYFIDQ